MKRIEVEQQQIAGLTCPVRNTYAPLFITLGTFLLGIFLLDLATGSVVIPLRDLLAILSGGESSKAAWADIVLKFRLPKTLTAALAGAALGVSGLQMQTLFRNPLAGPYTLGISSGASFGVALVMLLAGVTGSAWLGDLGLGGTLGMALAASLGSALVLLLILLVAHKVNTMTLLVLGLMFGYATSALVNVLLYFSAAERIQTYVSWTFGSFGGVTWRQLYVLAPLVSTGLLLAFISVKPLNAFLLGETYARSMGVSVKRVRVGVILSAALLAGSVTAFCGPVSFLGVAIPHLCRSLFNTSDHRVVLPAAVLLGGSVAVAADLVAQLPGSQFVLPLNAVTALIGAPVVSWVILHRQNLRSSFAT